MTSMKKKGITLLDAFDFPDTADHALHWGLDTYFAYYNDERKHSVLDKRAPAEVFMEGGGRV